MPTIEDVIKECEEQFGLKVTKQNREKYTAFLERQLKAHPEYDLNFKPSYRNSLIYCSLLVDKLMIFSYLTRERKVKANPRGDETLIDTNEKLHLLGIRGPSSNLWDDSNLFTIYQRRARNKKEHERYKLPLYSQMITDVGADKAVVDIWGRKLTYEQDIGGHHKSVRQQIFRQPKTVFTPKAVRSTF